MLKTVFILTECKGKLSVTVDVLRWHNAVVIHVFDFLTCRTALILCRSDFMHVELKSFENNLKGWMCNSYLLTYHIGRLCKQCAPLPYWVIFLLMASFWLCWMGQSTVTPVTSLTIHRVPLQWSSSDTVKYAPWSEKALKYSGVFAYTSSFIFNLM